jgi:sigma-B regulation protein RsbU (phosphoserine phosphatase)
MDETFQIANRYELKELELNSLLEITQAINENVAEDSLYKIYNFTLRANLSLSKLLLLVKDGGNWSTKVQFGTERDYLAYQLDASLSEKSVISHREALVNTHFNEFEVGIPVFHKGNLLAMVFLGGIAVNGHTKSLENRLNFIQALTNITMVAIENKKMARERLERGVYEKEMEIAKKVQQLLFPKCLPVSKNFKISAHYC